ncbi:MAG TPA: hypothetical protein DIW82_03980 [Corynebacterium nuruki]|uniref:Uncharacterized protein n=1 Tax=Corynebacterium nuruki TaxID=1032851 RepID=A0A3D4SXF7_9CORY|nr:hypothetical protein [Corynebacterium nuruki]
MDTTVSVIGPDEATARDVAAALQGSGGGSGGGLGGALRHRIVVGAGPDPVSPHPGRSFGVVAVVPAPCTAADARVVRAVVASVGGCVLYAESGGDDPAELAALVAEPGVVTVRWHRDAATGAATDRAALAELRTVLDGMWVDVPRWLADARRADADRADRVRITVRLAAEDIATDLLDGARRDGGDGRSGAVDTVDTVDTAALDAAFRSRLTVAVLEQGVEMPHLTAPEDTPDTAEDRESTAATATTDPAVTTRPDRSALALSALAAGGAALAAGAAAGRVAGAAVGTVVALAVAALVLVIRWRTLVAASRTRGREAALVALRRRWTTTVTDVVARLQVPSVAVSVAEETGVQR